MNSWELHLGDDVLPSGERWDDWPQHRRPRAHVQVSSRPVNGPAARCQPLSGNPRHDASPEGRSRPFLTIGVDIGMLDSMMMTRSTPAIARVVPALVGVGLGQRHEPRGPLRVGPVRREPGLAIAKS